MRSFNSLWNQYHDEYNGIWRYDTRIEMNGKSISQDKIIKKSWSGGVTLTGFDIGIVPAQKFTMVIDADSFSTAQDQKVVVKVRAVGDMGTTPYYTFGTYYTDKITREGKRYTCECLDCIKYSNKDSVSFSGSTMAEAVQKIAGIIGCTADTSNISYQIGNIDLTSYTLREILSFIASANGGNFIIDFNNVLRLIKLEIRTPVAAISTAIKTKKIEDIKELSGIAIKTGSESSKEYLAGGGENVLSLVNPLATQSIADALFLQLKTYNYTPCKVEKAFTNPALELGDTVRIRGVLTQVWNWNISSGMTVSFSVPSNFNRYDKYEFQGSITRALSKTQSTAEELTHLDIAKDLSFFAATYGDKTTSYATTLDDDGMITQLINRETGKTIGVDWV